LYTIEKTCIFATRSQNTYQIMNEEVELYLEDAEDLMEKAVVHLEKELSGIRAGKANPAILQSLKVEYYGAETPLTQVANVGTSDARTITVQPWEKKMIDPIERAIRNSGLGLNPQNNGEIIRIIIPMLTEDRRRDLVKQARNEGESARVAVRSIRKNTNEEFKKMQKDGMSEDAQKDAEDAVQKLTDRFIRKIDELLTAKEKDILTV